MAERTTAAGSARALALPTWVRWTTVGAAILNGGLGLLFLLGPELRLTPWPSPISPVLTRFIGAIILGNAAGAVLAYRQGTWDGARVLFYVAGVYGLLTIIFVSWAILTANVDQALWAYVAVSIPIEIVVFVVLFVMETEWRRGVKG